MADPVSWLLIEPGWQVVDADGDEVGRVEEVTGDSGADIFDGLAIASSLFARPRYVPAEHVGEIEEGSVRLTVDRAAVERLTSSRSRRCRSGARSDELVRLSGDCSSGSASRAGADRRARPRAAVRAAKSRRASSSSGDRAHRGDRPGAQLPRHRLLRAGARDDARRRAVPRRADARQGPDRDRRRPHDVLVARVRRLRAASTTPRSCGG